MWLLLAAIHRWLGVAGCLLFLLWFTSGIAMIYVRMPVLSTDERLAHAPSLAAELIRIAPRDAAAAAGTGDTAAMEVGMLGARPVYRIGERPARVVCADTGELLGPPSNAAAIAAARAFLGDEAATVRHVQRIDFPDQWTLQLRQHLPLHRLALDDEVGTELYVSSATGDVVLDTTRRERALAYIGPVAHWLYLPVLRRNGPLWTQVIIWSAGLGCVLTCSGMLVGLARVSPHRRFRIERRPSISPYRGSLKWHHLGGLVFGFVTFTWTFSGLLSMGPFSLLTHEGLISAVTQSVAGGRPSASDVSGDDVRAAVRALQSTFTLKEMRLIAFRGRSYWLGIGPAGEQRLVGTRNPWTVFDAFSRADVEDAARAVGSAELTWLSEYDDYYYDRRGRLPLPVLRARYAGEAATWIYLDPKRGAAARVIGRRDRANRWLYHGLHSLDPAWLRTRRPLWDIVVIALSLGGIALVATCLIPAWRRVRRMCRRAMPDRF